MKTLLPPHQFPCLTGFYQEEEDNEDGSYADKGRYLVECPGLGLLVWGSGWLGGVVAGACRRWRGRVDHGAGDEEGDGEGEGGCHGGGHRWLAKRF